MSISILSSPSQHIHIHSHAQYPAQPQLRLRPTTPYLHTTTPLQHRSSPPPTDQSRSRLLSLPAELRNIIWAHLLIQPPPTTTHAQQRSPYNPYSDTQTRVCAHIVRTCRQTYREGVPILYGQNKFAAHTQLLAGLPALLLVTRPARVALAPVKHAHLARLIRKFYLRVRLDTDPRFTAREVESAFAGVDELELDVFQAVFGGCDFEVLTLFEGVRGVGKAVVQGSVGDGRYAAWLARTMMLPVGTSDRVCRDDDAEAAEEETDDDRPERSIRRDWDR